MSDALHICLSGNPACSGINPCDACHQVYVSTILPKAMVAGGFNGDRGQAAAFFQAYGHARQGVLQHLARMVQPTLNAPDPGPVSPMATEPEADWQEGGPQLTDEEVAEMAAPPPHDFAPEPTEEDDVGMPDEDRAKEVAKALLKGETLTHKASPPPAGPEAADNVKSAPRRPSRTKKAGAPASKE